MQQVVIVGAGLAGAAAALRLSREGIKALVLEGRERIGGRAYLKPFCGSGPLLEFGGAWITPWHTRMRSLVAECGLSLRPRHPVTKRLWLRDGSARETGPTSDGERAAHERAISRVAADALLLKKGHQQDEKGRSLTGISFADYLDRLNSPRATRNLFSAWWTVSGNGDHKKVAASEFLASCAYGDGLAEAMIDFWSDTVDPGVSKLAERMLTMSGAEVRLGQAVSAIEQDGQRVLLHAEPEGTFLAEHCILALGVNQIRRISFSPALSDSKRRVAEQGHGGRAFKLWIKASGIEVGALATGNGSGIELAFAERETSEGETMVVAFGLTLGACKPEDQGWVDWQITRLFPGSRFLAYDWTDWVRDSFSAGTWVAAPVGLENALEAERWQPEERLFFASSDIARLHAGWFEAAVISGEDAAEALLHQARVSV